MRDWPQGFVRRGARFVKCGLEDETEADEDEEEEEETEGGAGEKEQDVSLWLRQRGVEGEPAKE